MIPRKTISIPIIEEESYEKNVVMYVNLGEPKHIAGMWNSPVSLHFYTIQKSVSFINDVTTDEKSNQSTWNSSKLVKPQTWITFNL